ncbi:toll/interleukin-1 receptor domain-containing protein [Anaerolineales bacterium HSG6]|nr:toll/interleukin-1 receptor domain-containing protein [Anaerolineales bacterium HSG6]
MTYYAENDKIEELIRQVCIMMPIRCDERGGYKLVNTYIQPHEDLTEEEEKEVKKLKKHIQSLTTSDEYEFDVFLAHNSKDKPAIRKIYKYLKSKGIRPWLDEEEIAPGRSFQEIIQAAIPKSKSAAVFIGEHDLGKWQSLELKTFISQCVEKDIPVIHVLLPETSFEQFPERLLFLQEFHGVDFKSIDDPESLEKLVWGITGEKPILEPKKKKITKLKDKEEEREVKGYRWIQSFTIPDEYEFDVFLAHNSKDKPAIRQIYSYLKDKGLRPWLDEKEIPPGRSFQEIIQAAIPKSKSAAIFIGEHDLEDWQTLELKVFISQCVEKEIPVIPVFLPEVSFEQFPRRLLFLKQFHGVDFKSIDDLESLDKLVWGITGEKPNSERTPTIPVISRISVQKSNMTDKNDNENTSMYNDAVSLLNIDVFIIHASKDKPIVEDIIKELQKLGITYWVDHEQIMFGDSITESIEAGVLCSKYILACLSRNFDESGWCRTEYIPALGMVYASAANKIYEPYQKVIPLVLGKKEANIDLRNIPVHLYDKRRVHWFDEKERKELLAYLSEGRVNLLHNSLLKLLDTFSIEGLLILTYDHFPAIRSRYSFSESNKLEIISAIIEQAQLQNKMDIILNYE